ncbi:MAG: hypothetical protein Q8851_01495 [Sweet potato little leaf phytoplasma]|nr:hypothetical protein [Sweet potato little leaf phytoplasma]
MNNKALTNEFSKPNATKKEKIKNYINTQLVFSSESISVNELSFVESFLLSLYSESIDVNKSSFAVIEDISS